MAGNISAANLGGVADARLGEEADIIGTSKEYVPEDRLHQIPPPVLDGHQSIYVDSSIMFEEYRFWAQRSREVEKHIRTDNAGFAQLGKLMLGQKPNPEIDTVAQDPAPTESEKKSNPTPANAPAGSDTDVETDGHGVTESEWEQAQRASRTATWGSIFYLITTDILGPTNVPWAISQMGYGPGFALYTVFGILACYSGLQLWKIYTGLDSTRFPMRNYGDLAFRVYGHWARILVNVLQSFQFFLNVTLLIVSNGQGLAQMAQGKSGNGYLCFIVAEVIFMLIGFLLGQIRTLQRLSWLANVAIWLNVVVIIMTMVVVHQYPPNYEAVQSSYQIPKGPIETSANWPAHTTLYDRVNGLMNCVFAYGGATLFNELMSEMRRPMDFWKGFICAEIFIYACYLINGMVVYSAQGQFTYNPSYQGIPHSAYAFQTLGNAISFITGAIAALLYGNIGIKIFYSAVLRDVFHLPPLDHRLGKWLWVALVPIYWVLAWVVAAAIPQISNLTSFVGAACILQFSYTFPPLLRVGYSVQNDAILPGEVFDPHTGQALRVDSGWKRWARGFKKQFALNSFDVIYFLAALGTAGLGIWASVIGMHEDFAGSALTPFTCKNPAS
ncbi:hypothetical protein N7474_007881 [Penicillium riverlandense]|uniref:uncharacterized protein n=1 Tax=Penicillium riverlandense TaxID=1903569 RepID=UPI002549770D|nr:uncharacterized protein N7474_007881 [Penicillium riverlandense]KAJ5811580.1 hypothetical protein N7474_007881 [Penicillium riverlandense]